MIVPDRCARIMPAVSANAHESEEEDEMSHRDRVLAVGPAGYDVDVLQ
jgi:hypothetical protein